MAQGRSSSAMIIALMLPFYMLVFHSLIAHAAIYAVGDAAGWSFKVDGWPNGQIDLKAGDSIVFNYDPELHDVVVVDAAGYNTCIPSQGDKVYQTGHDQVQLGPGLDYFISSIPGDCERGMKIAVHATL